MGRKDSMGDYYYSAYRAGSRKLKEATGYGEWLEFDENECIKQILKSPVPVTYSDNVYMLNNLYVKKAWKAIDSEKMYKLMKEKAIHLTTEEFKKWWLRPDTKRQVKIFLDSIKKERRKRLRKLILREVGQKKCFQWVVDDIIKYKKGDFFTVYNPVNNKSRECRIVKVIEQWRKPLTLILKRKDNGKHIKLKVTKDLISLWKDFYKEVKAGFEIDYVPKDGIGFIECVCVKILEGREKDEDKGGGILPKGAIFSEYAKPFVIHDYMKNIVEAIGKPGKIISCSRGYGRNFMYNEYLKDHLARIARCKERSKLIHIIDEREKLKEFHKRPYFKTILETVKGKSLGKEDLSKMEFPCYCTYIHAGTTELGVIDKIWRNPLEGYKYILSNRERQHKINSSVVENESLVILMRDLKIEILKGELRLWKVSE